MKAVACFTFVFFISALTVRSQDRVAFDTLNAQVHSGTIKIKVDALNELSRIFTGIDNNKAMQLANEAVQVSKDSGKKKLVAQSLNRLGTIYDYRGILDSANAQFLAALKIFEEINDKSGIAAVQQNIGVMYYFQGDLDKAAKYYERAMKLRMHTREMDFVAKLQNNLAIIYRRKKNYAKAIDYYNRALAIKLKYKDREAVANSYTNLATVYLYMENFDSAKIFLDKSMEINLSLNSPVNLSGNYFLLAEIFFNEGKFDDARKNLEISIGYAIKAESNDLLYNDYELLWRVDTALKDYKSAIVHIDQENIYKDKVFKQEKAEAVEKMNVLYETEKKDKAIVTLNAVAEQKKSQNRLLIISLILSFLILAAIVFFYYKLRQKNRLLAIQKQQVEEKTEALNMQAAEIARFRTQMNPHFMFNALVSIQKSILTEDKKTASLALTQLSKLMRTTLDNSEKEMIALSDEVKFLEMYIEFEKGRFAEPFTFSIRVHESIDRENTLIPPMLIQPFIENAIKHGLLPGNRKGELLVEIRKASAPVPFLTIGVTDNGVGRDASANSKTKRSEMHRSKGMDITLQRIKTTCREEKINPAFTIEDLYDEHKNSKGTSISFNLPLIENF